MVEYIFQRANPSLFAAHYCVYAQQNLYHIHDWQEQMEDAQGASQHFFIQSANIPIGGFALEDHCISHPFLIAPFDNRELFWTLVMDYMQDLGHQTIQWKGIFQCDQVILTDKYAAAVTRSQKRMLRPTGDATPDLDKAYYFSDVTPGDIQSIVQTVFQAHSAGYTAQFHPPDRDEIQSAVNKRLEAFAQTDSLHVSNLVKTRLEDKVIGVCIAGIYPDSANQFSTVHQLSVHPEYRRRGIARAMLQRAIAQAKGISPVITLGVMDGNPAQILYRRLGFTPGPTYHDLAIE